MAIFSTSKFDMKDIGTKNARNGQLTLDTGRYVTRCTIVFGCL